MKRNVYPRINYNGCLKNFYSPPSGKCQWPTIVVNRWWIFIKIHIVTESAKEVRRCTLAIVVGSQSFSVNAQKLRRSKPNHDFHFARFRTKRSLSSSVARPLYASWSIEKRRIHLARCSVLLGQYVHVIMLLQHRCTAAKNFKNITNGFSQFPQSFLHAYQWLQKVLVHRCIYSSIQHVYYNADN